MKSNRIIAIVRKETLTSTPCLPSILIRVINARRKKLLARYKLSKGDRDSTARGKINLMATLSYKLTGIIRKPDIVVKPKRAK